MKGFSGGFLRESGCVGSIFPAVIGKHPSERDFLAIGVESLSLATVKDLLYDQAALSAAGGQPKQASYFLWERESQFVLGCLWPSRDAVEPRPREAPLMICLHCVATPLGWNFTQLVELLQRLRREAHPVDANLKSLVSEATAHLRSASTDEDRAEVLASDSGVRDLIALHGAQELILEHSPKITRPRPGTQHPDAPLPPVQALTLSAVGVNASAVLLRCIELVRFQIDRSIPALLVWVEEAPAVKVVLGMPDGERLRSLYASPPPSPHVGEDKDALAEARHRFAPMLEAYRHGEFPDRHLKNAERKLPWLGAIISFLAIASLIGYLRFAPNDLLPAALQKAAKWLGRTQF